MKEVNRKENGRLLEKSEMKEGRLDAAANHKVAVHASIVRSLRNHDGDADNNVD